MAMWQSSFFYQHLDAKRRKNYDSILDTLKRRKQRITINDVDENELFECVIREHPEIFYPDSRFEMVISPFGKSMVFNYIYSENEIRKAEKLLCSVVDDFISKYIRNNQTVFEKLVAVHDFLTEEVIYDEEAAMCQDIYKYKDSYNVIGALLRKKCVCAGYAAAMKMICDALQINCEVVSGTADNEMESGKHAWNIVQINGEYQHIDITWDVQSKFLNGVKFPNYFYFNIDDQTMQKDHFWRRAFYPRCPIASYNYFKVNNMVVTDKRGLLIFLVDALEFEEKEICFQLSYDIGKCDVEQDYVEKVFNEAIEKCKFVSVSGYQYFFINKYRIYLFQPDYK